MAKSEPIPIRFEAEDAILLEKLCAETGLKGPDIVRRAIRLFYQDSMKRPIHELIRETGYKPADKEELTKNILHGLHLLRSTPGLPGSLGFESGHLQELALNIGDRFADSRAIEAASATARERPQDTKAFLAVADKLQPEDAHKLAEFSIPSLAAKNDIALAGLWLTATLRSAGFDMQGLARSLSTR